MKSDSTTAAATTTMVAMLLPEDAPWLGRWRALPSFEACEAEGHIWVRGSGEESQWARMPALQRHLADAEGRLTRTGDRVPVRRLPQGRWQAVGEFLKVRLPAAALPAQFVAPLSWGLEPAHQFREPTLLTLPFAEFAQWGLEAAAVRLKGLKFALSEDGRACVQGPVLPTLPGGRWCVEKGVATPAGWALPRGITAALVARSLQLPADSLALVHEDASVEVLPEEAFVEASRSALRRSQEGQP